MGRPPGGGADGERPALTPTLTGVDDTPPFEIEYLEPSGPIEVESLPDEFDGSHVRRSILVLLAVVAVVAAAVALVPGLASLRERFAGARPDWLAVAAGLQLL